MKVRDLDKLGEVLDELVTSGANQMNGIAFGVSKAETLKDEAREGGDGQRAAAGEAVR